jgi:hypothetical protein
VLYAGKIIKEIDLVASMDIELGVFSFLGTLVKNLVSSWPFRIAAIAVIVALIIIIFRKRKKNQEKTSDKNNYRILNYNDFMKLK